MIEIGPNNDNFIVLNSNSITFGIFTVLLRLYKVIIDIRDSIRYNLYKITAFDKPAVVAERSRASYNQWRFSSLAHGPEFESRFGGMKNVDGLWCVGSPQY